MRHELQVALEHHKAGRLAEAEQLYRQVLEQEPGNAEALHFLGVLAHQVGRNDAAIELIEKAHRHGRPQAQSLNSLGMAYLAANRARDAKRCLSKALAMKADYPEAHSNLGAALRDLGQMKEAEQSYRRSLALLPDSAQAHYNLANLLQLANKLDEAEGSYRRALELQPHYIEAYNNLGQVFWRQGRLQEAEQACRKVLSIENSYAQGHHNLGKVLEDLARPEDAERSYRSALALEPDQIETRLNLGNVLQALGRYGEAEECYRRILEVNPALATAHYNLGNALLRVDRHEEALQAYRKAIELDPDFGPARWILAVSQLPAVYGDQAGPERCRAAFSDELDKLARWLHARRTVDPSTIVQTPFHLPYVEANNRALLVRYGALSSDVMQVWLQKQRLEPVARLAGERIRVGIVSGHIREHSVWDAIVRGWVHELDRKRFELLLFHLGAKHDEETALARTRATQFEQGPKALREWVELIRSHRPDVLIYPEIAMDMTAVKLASLRMARVQMTTWGHPETSGLPTIDHYLSAELLEPPGAQQNYTEKLVTLPNLGCYYEERPVSRLVPDLARLGIEGGVPLLICPGTPFKYAPQHDWVLPAIAHRVPHGRFLFFTYRIPSLSEKLRRRLQLAFEREGLDFHRHVTLLPWLQRGEFYGLMERADVFLDTIGFSGFNTAIQAVECGLPVVTREGRFMRGRLASGILKRMQVPELVVGSEHEYVALAARLALDADYRRQMRERMSASRGALYKDLDCVRGLEDFLSAVVKS
jgi:predicted O-linked N-acetylglucosamine transferase (SPINDLY family)